MEAPCPVILKISGASEEALPNPQLTTHRGQQWKYGKEDFCEIRVMFKKHGGEFCTKLLRCSQKEKKKRLMND